MNKYVIPLYNTTDGFSKLLIMPTFYVSKSSLEMLILYWFLPYIEMNQPWVYMCPPPLQYCRVISLQLK